jgi:AcrR family transcriptional regulator
LSTRTETASPTPATAPIEEARRTDARILEVATRLFYEKGYHASTMREVAAGVGLKAGSLYNHYGGKGDLLFRIARDVMEELLEAGRGALAAQAEPRGQLRELIRSHVVYHAEHRFRAKVADDQLHALDPARRDEAIAVRDAYERLWRDVIEAGREAHGWAVPDTPVVTFAITTMCTAVDVWYREGGRLSPAEIAEIYADFVLGALDRGAGSQPP